MNSGYMTLITDWDGLLFSQFTIILATAVLWVATILHI